MKKRFQRLGRWNNPLGLRTPGRGTARRWTWKRIFRGFITLGAISIVSVVFLFAWYARDLPTPGKIRKHQPAVATQILDRNGRPLYAVFDDEKRLTLPADQIPATIKQATIAVEDKDFYKHHGVDLRGIVRGVILKPLRGQRAQGGSTITQQYVKNALLTSERSVDRKMKELIMALELEFMFTKDEILSLYLNEIPYGSNAYGVEAASQTFFGKHAKDLSLAEAATLAALPQRPSYLSPYGNHTDELKARRDFVLKRMQELSFIKPEDSQAATASELSFLPRRDQIIAPHFVFYVKDMLIEKYGEQAVLRGGLKVTTTLDAGAQTAAEQAIATVAPNLSKFKASNAAMAAVDPRTGQVLAMVGSVDYFDQEHQGNFNVATALRQPGSSFKPFAYATAFKGKWSPSSTLWDVTTDFGRYTPQNYNGRVQGPVTIRAALANSLNIPAVKVLSLAGIKETIETAQSLGISSLTEPDKYGLALVLGGAEVKPLEMAAAYGVFGNQGTQLPTTPILKVEDSTGKILEEWHEEKKEVLSKEIAYQITSILSDNEARTPVFGARSALYFSNRAVAVKTGTTQDYHDAWTVGYTPSIAAAVWIGNNNNAPMTSGGVVAAAPVFRDFINGYYGNQPSDNFVRPEGIKDMQVDALSGKLPTEHSPQTISDIFTPWQMPTERDDIHVAVQVNKINGKLATDATPPDLIETRVFTRIHSERPDNPNWEQPVLAWAQEHGYQIGDPPTEKDDADPSLLPSITIIEPTPGAAVTGPFEIEVKPTAPQGIRHVEFSIDNILIATKTTGPWTTVYNAADLSQGNHELTIQITDQYGSRAKATQLFIVAVDETPPGNATDTEARNTGGGSIKLSWKNPADADVDRVRIYRSTVSGQLGTLLQEVAVNPKSNSSATIAGHATATFYYFTLRPVDTNDNENSSTSQLSILAI